MLQEKITEKEITIVVFIKWIFSDSELANSFSLMEISNWAQFEYCLSNLESNRFNLFGYLWAAFKALTESRIRFAIQIFQIISPLILKHMVLLWWNS
jgi:hypothetical protein